MKGARQLLQSVWALVNAQSAIHHRLGNTYDAREMNVAGSNNAEPKGKAGGFDKHASEDPSLERERQSTDGSATQRCFGLCGRRNGASLSPAGDEMPSSGTDRSKAVGHNDDPKCRAQESDDGDVEYSPQYKRARRQLWVWRIVSYVLIAAVIGAPLHTLPRRTGCSKHRLETRTKPLLPHHTLKEQIHMLDISCRQVLHGR